MVEAQGSDNEENADQTFIEKPAILD